MRRNNTGSLNKEKLVFLVSALGVSIGVYFFLTSGPVPLVLSSPSTREPGPEPFKDVDLQQKKDINSLIDRDRVSPFEPFRPPQVVQPKVAPVANNAPPPPPPPPPPETPKAAAKVFESEDPISEVDYMGVTFVNGESRALLKPKDGSNPILVAVGEEVPNFKYIVKKIEPQAVWISDGDNRPFMLKDASFSEDSSSDSSSSSSSSSSSGPNDKKGTKPDKSSSTSSSGAPKTTAQPATTTALTKGPKKGKEISKPKHERPQPSPPPGN